MTSQITARPCAFWEGEPLALGARIESLTGVPVTPTQVTSFTVTVFENGVAAFAYETPPLPADVGFFNPLLYGYDNLIGDSGGLNFLYVIQPSAFAFLGGHGYRVQVATTIGASVHMQVYTVSVGEIL